VRFRREILAERAVSGIKLPLSRTARRRKNCRLEGGNLRQAMKFSR